MSNRVVKGTAKLVGSATSNKAQTLSETVDDCLASLGRIELSAAKIDGVVFGAGSEESADKLEPGCMSGRIRDLQIRLNDLDIQLERTAKSL